LYYTKLRRDDIACENIAKCIFFNDKITRKTGTATLLKKYAVKVLSKIAPAILCVKKGRGNVPSDLFPNQTKRALQITGKSNDNVKL